jgi:hypothetical protein
MSKFVKKEKCHNKDSAISLQEFDDNEDLVYIDYDVNNKTFRYCYKLEELRDIIGMARKNNKAPVDIYTALPIPRDIIDFVDTHYREDIDTSANEILWMLSSFESEDDVIDTIIQHKDYVSKPLNGDKTILQQAILSRLPNVVKYLFDFYTPEQYLLGYVDNNDNTALIYACSVIFPDREDEMEEVTLEMINKGLDKCNISHIRERDNMTAFMLACKRGLSRVALAMLDEGIDDLNIDSRDNSGWTAYDYAKTNNMIKVMSKIDRFKENAPRAHGGRIKKKKSALVRMK